MLISISFVFIFGIIFSSLAKKVNLPSLIGFIVAGIIVGPFVLNLLSTDFLQISNVLREIALLIIIFRAGLNLDINKLFENRLSVVLLSFLPASFEILACVVLGHYFLKLSIIDSAILGCVLSAVSPAVIVPNMIKIIDEKYGVKKGIPQMIMSAASIDDIYVITLFLALVSAKESASFDGITLVFQVISKIGLGVIYGLILGKIYNIIHKRISLSSEYSLLVIISIIFLINSSENILRPYIEFSALLSVMSFGAIIENGERFKSGFSKLWSVFEIILFVLIGSQLDLNYLLLFKFAPFIVVFVSLIVRSVGSFLATHFSKLNLKERIFVTFSFIPKATVQAAIGPIALSLGFSSGKIILTTAIIAILITAPIGDYLINKYYKKLLPKDNN